MRRPLQSLLFWRNFVYDILLIVLAIILPPVAAFLVVGLSMHFFLNILLTLLGGLPGIVHAVWLVLKNR